MRKKMLSLLLIVLVFLLAACSSSDTSGSENTQEPEHTETTIFDLNEYKSLVGKCRAAINAASILVYNAGKYEATYMQTLGNIGGSSDAESTAEKAFNWLAENSDATRETVDADYAAIRQQYKEIILIEIEGKEAEEIDITFRSMYDAYSSMYDLVTSPSGTSSAFTSKMNSYISTLKKGDEDIALFLD